MIRKKNLYSRPMKPFEAARIKEENELRKKYALKNKKEIWKTQAKINYFRSRAKELAKKPLEEQEVLLGKLKAMGLKTNSLADVLGLEIEDLLNRRITTIVAAKKLAHTAQQARQMVVHKKVLVDGKVVSTPSYLVSVDEESSIKVKEGKKKPKHETKEEKIEEAVEEVFEEEGEDSEGEEESE